MKLKRNEFWAVVYDHYDVGMVVADPELIYSVKRHAAYAASGYKSNFAPLKLRVAKVRIEEVK